MTKKTKILLAISVFIELYSNLVFAENDQKTQCANNRINYDDAVAFVQNVQQLVKQNNKHELAKLIIYPMGQIKNTESFIKNYDAIVSSTVKEGIINADSKGISCMYDLSVMLANGVIWFHGNTLKVKTINGGDESIFSPVPFQCNTQKHTILVDEISKSNYRYRSWNKPKTMTDKPDFEVIQKDALKGEGTGICFSYYFTFKKGEVEFVLNDRIRCTEHIPPENAIGDLSIYINHEEKNHYFCY